MFIDIHVHMTRTKSILRGNGTTYCTPEELVAKLDKHGIAKAVVLAGVSPECRHRYAPTEDVLEGCARFPDRLIPFCNIDPRNGDNSSKTDFRPFLKYYIEAGCRGLGELTANLAFDDPLVWNLLGQCAELNLPVTFHIGPQFGGCYGLVDELGLPRLERTLREFPDLILLGHSQPFWAEISADVTEETRRGYPPGKIQPGGRVPELMERYPNLYGDLSAGSGYNAVSRDTEFGYAFMEKFQDRLLFGTDFTSPLVEAPIMDYLNEALATGGISRQVFEKITWRNANRLLHLGLE